MSLLSNTVSASGIYNNVVDSVKINDELDNEWHCFMSWINIYWQLIRMRF